MRIGKWVAAGVILAVPAISHAFCGVYVAGEGKSIHNQGSRIVLARHDGRITLTLASDFTGDAADFGLVIPIPASVGEADVGVVDPALIEHVEQFTVPRMVSYTCEQVMGSSHDKFRLGCAADYNLMYYDSVDTAVAESDELDITIESQFAAGEYDITLISAGNGADLQTWLDGNGYRIPEGADTVLQEAIDGGRKFLAAKLRMDTTPAGRSWLSPLQIAYDGDALFLPIRIGTLSAEGVQDMTVYTITDFNEGAVQVDNYPEVTVEDECMWDPDRGEDLDAFYDRLLTEALDGQAGWITEYSTDIQGSAHCDPCTAPPFDNAAAYGWNGDIDGEGAHLTRLHLRYNPEQVTADVSFSTTGRSGMEQLRYIQYREALEFLFPVCEVGMITDDPGTCEEADERGGCDVPRREVSAAGLAAAAVLLRRRVRGRRS